MARSAAVTLLLIAAVVALSAASVQARHPRRGARHVKPTGVAAPSDVGAMEGPRTASRNNLLPHGNVVLSDVVVVPVYWGAKWNTTWAGRKPAFARIMLQNVLSTSYAASLNQYLSGAKPTIHVVPDTFDSSKGPTAKQDNSGAVYRNYICTKILPNLKIPSGKSVANLNVVFGLDVGPYAGDCAYHTYDQCTSTSETFTYTVVFPYSRGCSTGLSIPGKTADELAYIDSSLHELFEVITDPTSNGWYNRAGSEVIDLCEYNQEQPVTIGGQQFAAEGVWSNAVSQCVFSS